MDNRPKLLNIILDPNTHFDHTAIRFRSGINGDQVQTVSGQVSNYHGSVYSANPGDITKSSSRFGKLYLDKTHDVYIESFTTHNIHPNTTKDRMAIKLSISGWDINHTSNLNDADKSIIIPNESNVSNATIVYKHKKYSYVTSLNGSINQIEGLISFIDNTSIFPSADSRICLELIFHPRN